MPATLPDLYKVVEGAAQEEEERGTLADMLDEAFAAICRTVELADGRDLSERSRVVAGVLRLPFHPVILREAKARGKAAQSSRPSARAVAVDAGRTEVAAECREDPMQYCPLQLSH